MEELKILFITILGIFVLAGIGFITWRRKPQKGTDAATDYAAGLSHLLAGDMNAALSKLREAAKKDTSNVDAYIRIGDILRENNNAEQAIKVHRNLTARTTLNLQQKLHIFRSLVLDYEAMARYDLAHKVLQRIFDIKSDDLWAREKQLEYYEKEQRWDDAVVAYKALAKMKGKTDKAKIASYSISKGKQLVEKGREKDARIAFHEAMKIDHECVDAYLQTSESYIREGRKDDALDILRKFIERVPNKASRVFDPMRNLLFDIGEFGEIENIYSQVIEKDPENWEAYLALASIKDKKGATEHAIQLCQEILQRNPDYLPAREQLVRFYHREGKDILAVEQALAIINHKKAAK